MDLNDFSTLQTLHPFPKKIGYFFYALPKADGFITGYYTYPRIVFEIHKFKSLKNDTSEIEKHILPGIYD